MMIFHIVSIFALLYIELVLIHWILASDSDLPKEVEMKEIGETPRVYCPEDTVIDPKYGTFEFPSTMASQTGTEVRVKCPFGFRNDGFEPINGDDSLSQKSATATIANSKQATSGATRKCYLMSAPSPDSDTLVTKGVWSQAITSGSLSIISYCKADGWEESLQSFITRLETISPYNYLQLGAVVSKLNLYAQDDYDCAEALINGLAKLITSPQLNGDDGGIGIGQREKNLLFDYIDNFRRDMTSKLPAGHRFYAGDAGITVEVAKFYGPKRYIFQSVSLKSYSTHLETQENCNISVDVPKEALEMAIEQNTDQRVQLKITTYSHDVFRRWDGQASNPQAEKKSCLPLDSRENFGCEFSKQGCDEYDPPYKAWGLLCIELDGNIENLTKPVEFFISSSETSVLDGYQFVCVYWDEDAHVWSSDGVSTQQYINGIKCSTSHLSAFSALIEPLPLPFPGDEYSPKNTSIHGYVLSILSTIGSICSIVGLSLTLFTYGLFSSLRRERSNRILINLCTSLLFLHIMSVSGSKSLWDGHCFVPAASMHYLVLTSLAWMLVEAIHMYDLLISVFVRPETKFMCKRLVLAWGIPLVIVVVCAAVRPNVYKIGRAVLCLMSAHENIYMYYAAYIGPICIMLFVNFVIFCRIFRVLYRQTKRTHGMATVNGATTKVKLIKISPLQIKGTAAVFVLLGIGWILGLMAIGPFEVVFGYMFCLANAGQGLFIFLFRVALNPHACKQWKKVMLGLSPDSSLDVSVTTSSTVSAKQKKRKSMANASSPTFISAANSVENSLTASNPLSQTLAATLASILKSENERAAGMVKGTDNFG